MDLFQIANGTLYKWIKLYKNNLLAEKKKYNKKSIISGEIISYIKKYICKRIRFKCKLLLKQLKKIFKIQISISYLYEIIKKKWVNL